MNMIKVKLYLINQNVTSVASFIEKNECKIVLNHKDLIENSCFTIDLKILKRFIFFQNRYIKILTNFFKYDILKEVRFI